MSATTFDTHAYVKKLQEAGFTAQQAEAQVEVLFEVVEGNLATKHDIELVRRDMKEMEGRTEIRLKELDAKIELVRRDIIIWLGGLIIVATTVLGTLIKL